eukprot:sb/3466861/
MPPDISPTHPISLSRSGLNLQSQFNLENVTEYSNTHDEDVTMETETKEISKYKMFCDTSYVLMKSFPNQISNDANWKKMEDTVNEICRIFENYKHEGSEQVSKDEAYFAKFLTSERLLTLQIMDSNFRRHILVQILTLFHYLTGDVKFRPNKLILSEPRKFWIRDTTNNIYSILSETPPDGPQFVKHIKSVLKYEEKWSKWKNEGCPSLSKPAEKIKVQSDPDLVPSYLVTPRFSDTINFPRYRKMSLNRGPTVISLVQTKQQQKGVRRTVRAMDLNSEKFDLGNPTLNELWNICPDNLAACQDSNRNFTPDVGVCSMI